MPLNIISLRNDLWEVEIAPVLHGRVSRLADRRDGTVYVQAPELPDDALAEGGRVPAFGLDAWTKSGDQPDLNTGVLSAFAAVFRQPLTVETRDDGARLDARHAGLHLQIDWTLPAGSAPLRCRLALTNESAPTDDFQFEGFFGWHVPDEERLRTALLCPGHAAVSPKPYGEISFLPGAGDGCAALWTRGTSRGVVMRGVDGIEQYFSGVSGPLIVLGPHSRRATLAPGDTLTADFEIAPLWWAQAQGWAIDTAAAESALAAEDAQLQATIARVGTLADWVAPSHVSPIARRVFHMTVQYGPSDFDHCLDLLERFVAPAGYTHLLVEVDRAFPFRSHQAVAPAWAWTRAQWRDFLAAARRLGLEPFPLFNSLAHMHESGVTIAYPEMREDDGGWCLCPRHPRTQQVLGDIFDELLQAFTPTCFHVGLDEVDVPSRPQTFRLCPRCRETDGGTLFAEHINALYRHLSGQGTEVMMWADMLLYREEHNTINGLRTGMWRAIDRLPRELIMVDWVYSPVEAYGGSDYLLEQGFRVMGASWHDPSVLLAYLRYAVEKELYGMCQTTWSGVSVREWPMLTNLLAAKYFVDPQFADYARALEEAKAFATLLADAPSRSR